MVDLISSRFSNSSLFLGANSLTIDSKDFQKVFALISNPGRTSPSRKSLRSEEIFKLNSLVLFSEFLDEKTEAILVNIFIRKLYQLKKYNQ